MLLRMKFLYFIHVCCSNLWHLVTKSKEIVFYIRVKLVTREIKHVDHVWMQKFIRLATIQTWNEVLFPKGNNVSNVKKFNTANLFPFIYSKFVSLNVKNQTGALVEEENWFLNVFTFFRRNFVNVYPSDFLVVLVFYSWEF